MAVIAEHCKQETLVKQAGFSLDDRAALITKKLNNGTVVTQAKLRKAYRQHGVRKKVIKRYKPEYRNNITAKNEKMF